MAVIPGPVWLLWEPTEGRRWVKKTPGAMGVVLRFAWAMPKALGRAVYSWSARLPERASCLGSGGGRGEEEVRSWGVVARVGAGTATLRLGSWGRGCSTSFNKGFFLIYFFFWAFCSSWNTSQMGGENLGVKKREENFPERNLDGGQCGSTTCPYSKLSLDICTHNTQAFQYLRSFGTNHS